MHSSSDRYRSPAKLLHWVTALIVMAVVIPAGVWIRYFEPADQSF
jgi:cytochrome b561